MLTYRFRHPNFPCPDYTHVIALGTNDLVHAGQAISRYSLGGVGYQDPVDFHMVFEVDAASGFPVLDDNGLPVPTFAPMIEVSGRYVSPLLLLDVRGDCRCEITRISVHYPEV